MTAPGKVIVLGAGGFFGKAIATGLEQAGHDVARIDRAAGGELLDPEGLNQMIASTDPAVVINAAGVTSPAAATADPAGCFSVNAGGTLNLLEAMRRQSSREGGPGPQLIALSSAAVYSGDAPFGEDSPTRACTPYAASKLAMEILVGQYARGYGLPATVLRCFNLTGPGEPGSQATSQFARAALTCGPGAEAEIKVGEPATARDFTDVRDAAAAVRKVVEERITGTFNICSGRATSLTELAQIIGEMTGAGLVLRGSGSGRPASGLLEVRGDGSRIATATGWRPEIPLRTSLTDLLRSLA